MPSKFRYLSTLFTGLVPPLTHVHSGVTPCRQSVIVTFQRQYRSITGDSTQNKSMISSQDKLCSVNDHNERMTGVADKNYLEELAPPPKKSFNFAAYVNHSETLQQLIKLGVSLYDIENTDKNAARFYLNLDFEKDCLPYIKFLKDNGLEDRNIGRFISQFPMIFKEDLDDLQTRINYFEAKGFSKKSIAHAINKSALILSHKTKTVDFKLGQLQIEFRLPAILIRKIVTSHPDVLRVPLGQYKLTNFTLMEEFGFKEPEIHQLLEAQPNLIELPRTLLIDRIDLVHNVIGLSHKTIAQFPKLITGPRFDISHRFQYLKKLKRNQFNPIKPLYVPPSALYQASDEEFCSKYAKTNLEDYKLFLKSR